MRRGFCPECGTPLFSLAESRPHLSFIRAGALDDPDLLAPQAVIWTDAAPDWAHLDPDLPPSPAQIPPIACKAACAAGAFRLNFPSDIQSREKTAMNFGTDANAQRSEERCVWKEYVSPCRSRWPPDH